MATPTSIQTTSKRSLVEENELKKPASARDFDVSAKDDPEKDSEFSEELELEAQALADDMPNNEEWNDSMEMPENSERV